MPRQRGWESWERREMSERWKGRAKGEVQQSWASEAEVVEE